MGHRLIDILGVALIVAAISAWSWEIGVGACGIAVLLLHWLWSDGDA